MYIGRGYSPARYTLLNAGRLRNFSQGFERQAIRIIGFRHSGAQAKSIEIAQGVGIIAEVDYSRIKTRYDQDGKNFNGFT